MKTNISKYLPSEILKIEEYRALNHSFDLEFDLLKYQLDGIQRERYVLTATNKGLTEWEKQLKIKNTSQDIETRRLQILARKNLQAPYTDRTLRQRLDIICGEDNYKLQILYDKYTIILDTVMTNEAQFNNLLFMLNSIIPCHILILNNNTIHYDIDNKIYVGTGLFYDLGYTITHDNRFLYDLDNTIHGGMAIGQHKTYSIN